MNGSLRLRRGGGTPESLTQNKRRAFKGVAMAGQTGGASLRVPARSKTRRVRHAVM